jgi:hypothetical protein
MIQGNDVFMERIAIDGIGVPVCFTFRMMHGKYHMEYKIRTSNPDSDFNMSNFNTGETITFQFTNKSEVPAWLYNDKDAETKLSDVITRTF